MSEKAKPATEEYERFPCGCRGRFEIRSGRRCLVVSVNPNCKWDATRIGRDFGFVFYKLDAEGGAA